jgi:hypothetical protein
MSSLDDMRLGQNNHAMGCVVPPELAGAKRAQGNSAKLKQETKT